jgi:hypothetical protein
MPVETIEALLDHGVVDGPTLDESTYVAAAAPVGLAESRIKMARAASTDLAGGAPGGHDR